MKRIKTFANTYPYPNAPNVNSPSQNSLNAQNAIDMPFKNII